MRSTCFSPSMSSERSGPRIAAYLEEQFRRSTMDLTERRRFLAGASTLGACALAPLALADDKPKKDEKKKDDEEVTATEDLMREHGVLNRILLIYEEGLRRMDAKEDISPDAFSKPAQLVRKFVEEYHEKLEENFIFTAFEKAHKLTDLVKTLRQQHEAGRKVTEIILRNAHAETFRREDSRKELAAACRAVIRMYRPHEAREDTV